MKKFVCGTLAIVLAFVFSINCYATVLDNEYSPEKYTNVSGNFSAKAMAQDSSIFKIAITLEQIVVVSLSPADPSDNISIEISDAEDRLCAETVPSEAGTDGKLLCAYKPLQSGTYYINVLGEGSFTYDIDIAFLSAPEAVVSDFPYSAYMQEGSPKSGYLLYSFALDAGDAFSLKTDINYSYILFSSGTNVSGCAAKLYSDEFYGYCAVAEDSCVATAIVPFPAGGEIRADVLKHNDYAYGEITLPHKLGALDMQGAMPPFEQDNLDAFTADFGAECIDNSPVKFFSFNARMNQILQLSAKSENFAACSLVYSAGEADSPASAAGLTSKLNAYLGENDTMYANTLLNATGKYMLSVRGNDNIEINLEAFEAFSTTTKIKPAYSYGESLGKIEIKNLFVDTNFKDSAGNVIVPRVSCYKLIDQKGNRYYYPPDESITPNAGNSYNLFAVIADGDSSYQVFLGSFKAEKGITPQENPQAPATTPNSPEGLTWWMILLIIIGGFCLACVVFLLVYKKDINEVE